MTKTKKQYELSKNACQFVKSHNSYSALGCKEEDIHSEILRPGNGFFFLIVPIGPIRKNSGFYSFSYSPAYRGILPRS